MVGSPSCFRDSSLLCEDCCEGWQASSGDGQEQEDGPTNNKEHVSTLNPETSREPSLH